MFATLTLIAALQLEPKQVLLICSCGEPVAFGYFNKDGARLDPASNFNDMLISKLRSMCKSKTINVWHTERITRKACPLSL